MLTQMYCQQLLRTLFVCASGYIWDQVAPLPFHEQNRQYRFCLIPQGLLCRNLLSYQTLVLGVVARKTP